MPPRVRQGIQFMQHDELNGELRIISDDEAASLIWAAQWLDEHREYMVVANRLDNTADPDDTTTTLVIALHHTNEHEPGRLGPWPTAFPRLCLGPMGRSRRRHGAHAFAPADAPATAVPRPVG